MDEKLGIPYFTQFYLDLKDGQTHRKEVENLFNFLRIFLNKFVVKYNLKKESVKIEFINYGKTELVFVVKINESPKYTCLVGQPSLSFGEVKCEANNLIELNKVDNNVIKPIDYYTDGKRELYITNYIFQARCIASNGGNWGMYVPEPFYHFEVFGEEQRTIVNKCMIAKIVSLYNANTSEGIAFLKLGGGDFMLPKGWENNKPTIENTLNSLMLIAARKKIKCSFEEYIELIKREFNKITINSNGTILNKRARAAMSDEEIIAGIELGKDLRKRNIVFNTIKK